MEEQLWRVSQQSTSRAPKSEPGRETGSDEEAWTQVELGLPWRPRDPIQGCNPHPRGHPSLDSGLSFPLGAKQR